MNRWTAVVLVLVAGCIESSSVLCKGHVCPATTLCSPRGCVVEDQLTACSDAAELAACTWAGTTGVCHDGVCLPIRCGDGVVEGAEDCDGAVGAGMDCTSLGYYAAGTLACRADCTFDRDLCAAGGICGDDQVQLDFETCDSDALGASTDCRDLGFYDAHPLTCTSTCRYNTSACTGFCGDGVVEGPEGCDGKPPADSCLAYGYDTGRIGCTSFCAPAVTSCERFGWQRLHSGPDDYWGLWVAGPTDVYALAGTIDHWNGSQWSRIDVGSTTAKLWAMWGPDPSLLFAVGEQGAIFKRTGTTWSSMTSNTTANLNAVWGTSATDVYAVGKNGTIVHYNGAVWAVMDSGTTTIDLDSIHGTASNDLWAVGANVDVGGDYRGHILHYNGSNWSVSFQGAGNYTYISAVWAAGPNDVFAVGDAGAVYHYDGAWTPMSSGNSLVILYAVWGSRPDDVYAAGFDGVMLHYNGTAWSTLTSSTSEPITELAGLPTGELFAVGYNGAVLRSRGRGWSSYPTASQYYLEDVWVGDSVAYAAGFGGTSLRFDGTTWTPVTGFIRPHFAVWGTSDSDVWGVGFDGVYRLVGNAWVQQSVATGTLYGIWGSGPNDMFVGGCSGIWRYNGSWASVAAAAGWCVDAIWGASSTSIYATGFVGGEPRIDHSTDGISWTEIPRSTWDPTTSANAIWDVWASANNDVFVVGDGAVVIHFNGITWRKLTLESFEDLFAVWGRSATDVFIGGTNDTLLHYDGVSFTPIKSPVSGDITGIHGDDERLVVVTSDGSIGRLQLRCSAAESACGDTWDDDCDGQVDCADPDCSGVAVCTTGGTCHAADSVACGETIIGFNRTGVAKIDHQQCAARATTGPEASYAFTASVSGSVTVTLAGLDADLDLAVLGSYATGGCDVRACIATSSAPALAGEQLTFTATAGQRYAIVIDGVDGVTGRFELQLACP